MGNTTRRQPISFGIPASPDYKFLNITDFAGLHVTNNPFTAKANTASDALNVYVDENNALTTRPRLEKVNELLVKINQPSMILIDIYVLNSFLLVHGLVGETAYLYVVKNNTIYPVNNSTYTIPKTKCVVYEYETNIYLIHPAGFFRIHDMGESVHQNNRFRFIQIDHYSTEDYVPSRRSVNATVNPDLKGVDIEPLNLLSQKYKELYFWNGLTKLPILDSLYTFSHENKYKKHKENELDSIRYRYLKYVPEYVTRQPNTEAFLTYDYSSSPAKLRVAEIGNDNIIYYSVDHLNPSLTLPYYADHLYVDSNDDASIIAYCYCGESSDPEDTAQTLGGVFLLKNGEFKEIIKNTTDKFKSDFYNNKYRIKMTSDASRILTYTTKEVLILDYVESSDSYDTTRLSFDSTTYSCVGIEMSDDGEVGLVKLKNKNTSSAQFHKIGVIQNKNISYLYDVDDKYDSASISVDGNIIAICQQGTSASSLIIYKNFKDSTKKSVSTFTNTHFAWDDYRESGLAISEDLDKIYFHNGYWVISEEWFFKDDLVYTYAQNSDGFMPYATTDKYYYYTHYRYKATTIQERQPYVTRNILDYSQLEPLLEVTLLLTDSDEDYEKWNTRRQELLSATLTVDYDNNKWFASGNKLFYSAYGNRTYVPMSNYNILGDSENITGFNLANDNTLIAYKTHKLHIITPTTINDVYTYAFQDTKNTVGNEAIGASIVTTLSEKPLQITKDGIYALNQLKNVQSSDRISVLISEKINQKWLDELDESIYNCKTLNRLYWTYFILNDEKHKITKVYLLDNRTSSWYYWELPIQTIKAYVNDNKTTFIDVDGNVYELKTNDTFNPFNPDVTEYYDDGRKLIKWFWKSQILPLGTINYSKRLINTTFIVTDTDESDKYGLNYSFRIYRKLVSESNTTTISNDLNYVQSVTKKTMIPRFNFIQITLSNIEEADESRAFDNNKFRLIGLGLKYVLLEGLY